MRNRRDPTRSGFVGPAFGRGVLLQVIQPSLLLFSIRKTRIGEGEGLWLRGWLYDDGSSISVGEWWSSSRQRDSS